MRRIVLTFLVVLCTASFALGQTWEGYYQPTDERREDFSVLVLDPNGGPGPDRYHFMPLSKLLAGLGVFDKRYVAVLNSQRAFTADDFRSGASGVGITEGVRLPAVPAGAKSTVRVGVAIPAHAPIPHLAVGSVNSNNHLSQFAEGRPVQLDGLTYAVRVATYRTVRARTAYVFFDAAAVAGGGE